MHKVFLVDDEIIVRESIRTTIDWDSTPYSLVGEAPDGEMALSIMMDLKPDILLTDIRMPFMDGLALAKIVRKNMPWIRIIILSGHDEFEYAKQAISIGVSSYLLKPIGPHDLLLALDKAAEDINQERMLLENLERMKKQLQNSAADRSEKLLEDLIMGSVSTAEALDLARVLGINLQDRKYLIMTMAVQITPSTESAANSVMDLSPGQSDESPEDSAPFAVKQMDNSAQSGCLKPERLLRIRTLLERAVETGSTLVCFYSSMNRYVALLKGDSTESLEEQAYMLASALRRDIEQQTGCPITIAIGSVVDRIAEIQLSYSDADQVLRQVGILGSGKTFSVKDLMIPHQASLKQLSSQVFSEKIRFASREDIEQLVNDHFDAIGEHSLHSLLLAYYILMDVLVVASQMIEEYGGSPAELIPESQKPDQLTRIASSRDELHRAICSIVDRTLAYRDSRIKSRYTDVILKACSFIEANYARADLSLHQVAAQVSLSNNHFCTVFAQETGQTFIEYLTGIRIRRARQLLGTTQMLASEIAYAVGYNDPHYFSYIFKKHAGMPPREYRAQLSG